MSRLIMYGRSPRPTEETQRTLTANGKAMIDAWPEDHPLKVAWRQVMDVVSASNDR